ncbi:MAG: Crp/Fnr family transcriptional regulator [Syntrophaceae bacterium]|nr:Crp/Fnr family transcriptional regulator [Syntrophaceae bacterium]
MNNINELQNIDLFQGVSLENLKLLNSRVVYKKFKSGEKVIGEEEPIREFYVVISGKLRLYKSSSEGKEQTLFLLGPGDPFGLCTAFATDSFPAYVMAIEASSVLTVPGMVIESISLKEPVLLLNIIRKLSERLKESMTLIESLSLKEIPGRLASFLLHHLAKNPSDKTDRLELDITQRELAKILGSTPEALSRALRKMVNEGVLAVEDGQIITILDYRKIEELAEGE